ncbi:hypothetical protein LTR78_007313 [Recurvomyces mirabilis]|uniref:NIMA interactive protein n=1 Tax=Recurvomyces mirabilis TaxID=574656 RepID=A0AAE0WHF7_9PEZI|nr:hypothetical protein LTR78_007313 [Recurvomyces mirabilis]KAK5155098.1 hypothetical protein LTS14_006053 [Recurvomyces mirabilis]
MDHESLRTASTYLNNLLLARGLLRNSEPVDFVKPSKDSRAQIINLVHDLILREDRDKDSREHVAVTLRTLRAEDARKAAEIEKLKEKCEASARDTVQMRATERTAKDECKKAERSVKSLQDQASKLKTSLTQVKTQCINDVRKRDLELARLKTHLQGQQRGNKVGMAAPSMTVVGGARSKPAFNASVHELRDPEYSLKQETTEFLTQLSQSLSDENDGLISLVRGALGTMRDLLGLPASQRHPDSAVGSMGSNEDAKNGANMEQTLTHLKSILSNPNFVTVEEVEVREEEIARLRQGWEHMEQRWKEILLMMDSWRRKMDTGDTINIEDLRKGMGLCSPERQYTHRLPAEPEQSFVDGDSVSEIRLPGIEEVLEPSIAFEAPRLSSPAKSSPKRKRDVLEPPEFFDLRPAGPRSMPASPGHEADNASAEDMDEVEQEEDLSEPQLSVEEKLRAAQVDAELAAAAGRAAKERAAAAEEPRMSTSKRSRSTRVSFCYDRADDRDEEQDDTLGKIVSPIARKTKIRGRPKRRKSTLNPDELEALLMVDDV